MVIVDHFSGFVSCATNILSIHIFADPFDPTIEGLSNRGELIWGWTSNALAMASDASPVTPRYADFSVAHERLRCIVAGVKATIHVSQQGAAEQCVKRIRDDLWTLSDAFNG